MQNRMLLLLNVLIKNGQVDSHSRNVLYWLYFSSCHWRIPDNYCVNQLHPLIDILNQIPNRLQRLCNRTSSRVNCTQARMRKCAGAGRSVCQGLVLSSLIYSTSCNCEIDLDVMMNLFILKQRSVLTYMITGTFTNPIKARALCSHHMSHMTQSNAYI